MGMLISSLFLLMVLGVAVYFYMQHKQPEDYREQALELLYQWNDMDTTNDLDERLQRMGDWQDKARAFIAAHPQPKASAVLQERLN